MSTHRYDRFKESREENANTFGARCARYFAEDFTPDDPGASAYSTQCPCDAKDPSAPNQATGCEYLPFEQLPPEQRKVYRSKEDQVVDAVSLAFVILFVLWVFRVWHRTRREDRARARSSRRVRCHTRNTHSTKRITNARLTASTTWSSFERYTFRCSGGSCSKGRYSHPVAWFGADGSFASQGHCVEYADAPGSSGVKSSAKYRAHRAPNVFAFSSRLSLNRS